MSFQKKYRSYALQCIYDNCSSDGSNSKNASPKKIMKNEINLDYDTKAHPKVNCLYLKDFLWFKIVHTEQVKEYLTKAEQKSNNTFILKRYYHEYKLRDPLYCTIKNNIYILHMGLSVDVTQIDGIFRDVLIVPKYYSKLTLDSVHEILQFFAVRTLFPKEKEINLDPDIFFDNGETLLDVYHDFREKFNMKKQDLIRHKFTVVSSGKKQYPDSFFCPKKLKPHLSKFLNSRKIEYTYDKYKNEYHLFCYVSDFLIIQTMFSNTTFDLYYKQILVTRYYGKKYNKKNDIKNFDKSQSNESCSEDSDNSDNSDKDKNNNETDEESEPGSSIYDMLAMEEYKE